MKKNEKFPEQIEKSAKELMKARREKSGFMHYAYVLGVGGWLFVIPVVAGAYFGKYLDKRFEQDVSFTLALTLIGTVVGIYNLCYFLLRKM
jgi:ATP synthase protein I